ncbi:FAD-dependent oxidoreductase [Streptomyces sp. NPDC048564]|uniref:FAD-dependent oxidoreductase n=1 Tax=Streptomyces sp. NPDC048564 TaxID=3155760 RepID=UPI00344343E7
MSHRLVVVGAGYAGLLAAKRLARKLRRRDVSITLVNASDRFVERGRLHQLAAGQKWAAPSLRQQLSGTSVQLVVGRVTAIDTTDRTVCLDLAPGAIGYDTLVHAVGSRARLDDAPGQSSVRTLSPPLSRRRGCGTGLPRLRQAALLWWSAEG